jgi:hypothetical protein
MDCSGLRRVASGTGWVYQEGRVRGGDPSLVGESLCLLFHRNLVWAIGRAKDLSLITHRVCVWNEHRFIRSMDGRDRLIR